MKYKFKIADDNWNVMKIGNKEVIFEIDSTEKEKIHNFFEVVFENKYNLLGISLSDCDGENER